MNDTVPQEVGANFLLMHQQTILFILQISSKKEDTPSAEVPKQVNKSHSLTYKSTDIYFDRRHYKL